MRVLAGRCPSPTLVQEALRRLLRWVAGRCNLGAALPGTRQCMKCVIEDAALVGHTATEGGCWSPCIGAMTCSIRPIAGALCLLQGARPELLGSCSDDRDLMGQARSAAAWRVQCKIRAGADTVYPCQLPLLSLCIHMCAGTASASLELSTHCCKSVSVLNDRYVKICTTVPGALEQYKCQQYNARVKWLGHVASRTP